MDAERRPVDEGEARRTRKVSAGQKNTETEAKRFEEEQERVQAGEAIMGYAKLASDNNPRQRNKMRVFMLMWAGQPPVGALVWFQPGVEQSFPQLGTQWLEALSAHMLVVWKQGTMDACQTTTGWMYGNEGKANPWAEPSAKWKRITAGYKKARGEKAKASGDKQSSTVQGLIPAHAQEASVATGLEEGTAPEHVSEIALLNIGIVCLLRGSSLRFKKEDVQFLANGTLAITPEKTKGKARDVFKQTMWVPPAADGTPRGDFLKLVKKALDGQGLNLIESEKTATRQVNAMIERHFPPAVTGLDENVSLTSHCLRRTGASALHSMCGPGDFMMIVMPWGGWTSEKSAKLYTKNRYLRSVWIFGLWDFLMERGAVRAYLAEEVPVVQPEVPGALE